jgi:hypothetical protein
MLKNLREKITVSGVAVLTIGVALLIFTFISAYVFLTQGLSIIASANLTQTFGQALAPLIAASVHIMYLGVMGWVGSLLTLRGVAIITQVPKAETVEPQKTAAQPQPQQKTTPQKAKAEPEKEAKPEKKTPPTELVVIPPEQVAQPPPQQKEKSKNGSSPQ